MLICINFVIQWIFFINSRLVIDFLTIMGFTTPLIYFELLSLSTISVPLNQQTRGILALHIVDIAPNLVDKIKNYQSALTILTKKLTLVFQCHLSQTQPCYRRKSAPVLKTIDHFLCFKSEIEIQLFIDILQFSKKKNRETNKERRVGTDQVGGRG